jgi:uncharacterized iron-regulated membrane protein
MALYRAVWRWHFYAGVVVAPFLLILAVTGAIYLFNDEINDALYGDMRFARTPGPHVPLSQIEAGALKDYAGKVTRIDSPTSPERTYQVFVTPMDGGPIRVFVEPATGQALGHFVYAKTIVGIADQLHGSLLLGDYGDAIVEIASCWALILAVTGIYLWWPRGRLRLHQILLPRFDTGGRRFWKSFHAAVGIWTAFLMIFLILSGLPWATVWGSMFRQVTQIAGIGYPESVRAHGAPASATETVKDVTGKSAAPWTVEGMPAPQSDPHAGHHGHGPTSQPGLAPRIGLDTLASIIAANGMSDPFRLSIPRDATGVFSVFTYPDQPEGQHSLYIDQYSGRIVREVRFSDYGVAAKAIELGVQIHMGNYFGRLNQIIMLVACLGIIFLSITGPYMWWLRRPKGSFGAPKVVAPTTMRSLALIVGSMALLFPLAGASLIVVLIGDWLSWRIFSGARAPMAR